MEFNNYIVSIIEKGRDVKEGAKPRAIRASSPCKASEIYVNQLPENLSNYISNYYISVECENKKRLRFYYED